MNYIGDFPDVVFVIKSLSQGTLLFERKDLKWLVLDIFVKGCYNETKCENGRKYFEYYRMY